MERTLNMKWDAVKKGIPCNVSCCNDNYLPYNSTNPTASFKKPTKANYKSYIWAKPFLPVAYPGFFKSTLWQENDLCTVR